MCRSIRRRFPQDGYTLIEFAIVLVIIGVLAVPAIALYHQHKIKSDYERTGTAIAEAVSAIGDFRSAYGRYPCPAPANVSADNPLYGLENCTLAISTPSVRTGMGNIVIGSLPFKSMNLQEKEVYDAYGKRLTYAVTANLADTTLFEVGNGGITLEDKNGDSLISPVDSGHFVVLSHGSQSTGAYTREGITDSACGGSASEAENCDNDSTFRIGNLDANYDDRVSYFTPEEIAEWQLEISNTNNMVLKKDRDIAIGVSTSDDVSNAERSAIRSTTSGSGGVTANSFSFRTNNICEYGESTTSADCFNPNLLAGNHAPGDGLVCPSTEPFLTGINNGEPVCESSITIGCPDGMFLAGLDSNRSPICRGTPSPGCAQEDIVTTCGETRTLEERDHEQFSLAYSGQCYRFPSSHDTTFFADGILNKDATQRAAWITELNAVAREQSDCGSASSDALVRDAYQCNAGTWEHASAHERLTASYPSFPSDYYTSNSNSNVEQNYDYSISFDLMNDTSQHDCWCREDYRIRTLSCQNGLAGNRIQIQKYRCPQTNSSSKSYVTVYEDTSNCSCVPSPRNSTPSCASYYNQINNTNIDSYQLSGTVYLTYNRICNSSGALEDVEPPASINISDCACPDNDPIINRTDCPEGTTNNFTWSLGGATHTETGVQAITTQEFICPNSTDVTGMPAPGDYQNPAVNVPNIPACTCDGNYSVDQDVGCPDGQEGELIKEFVQNCNTGQMEDSGVVVKNTCNTCSWNKGNKGEDSDITLGGSSKQVGKTCNCGSDPAPVCWSDGGTSNKYKTYTNCQCVADVK